jgi:ribosome assembly protein YihI (activator of Der GTPase)
VWDDAEQMLDDMSADEMLDHLQHEFMDKALKKFEQLIIKNRISEDDAAEFAMQQGRNDKDMRHDMIAELAERLAKDTV